MLNMPPPQTTSLASIVATLWLVVPWLALASTAPSALAAPRTTPAADGTLVKVVVLSRHGVRSPIPSQSELDAWTASPWPIWDCDGKVCDRGQLTPRGRMLAEQMGTYYRGYLAELIPADQCPDAREVFVWADVTERTRETGLALLRGFRPPSCNLAQYFHTAHGAHDRIFHPVRGGDERCKLDPARAERDMTARAGGSLSHVARRLHNELTTAQSALRCCQPSLCQAAWNKTCRQPPPAPKACTLTDRLPSCLVRHPETGPATQVTLGGALRMASTFAELLLLEYANGFAQSEVGWGRITRAQMTQVFRLHTTAFALEQRTPYVAALQGSMLLRKILLALKDEADDSAGSAPAGAKLVAYVGHDTNIANVAGMLSLSWRQPGYQRNQTPPAGALIFELRQTDEEVRTVYAYYVAQSLDDMRNASGTAPVRTRVRIPGCGSGTACSLDNFAKLVERALDPDCSQ